jgi:glycosyltransferase involved in cell wall biosynthesis
VIVSEGNEQCRLTTGEGVGRCVDIDDPAAIAAACADLLTAPADERRALRAHCREVALARYTWDHTAVGLVELYRKLAREQLFPIASPVRDGASPRGGAAA